MAKEHEHQCALYLPDWPFTTMKKWSGEERENKHIKCHLEYEPVFQPANQIFMKKHNQICPKKSHSFQDSTEASENEY